MFGRKREVGLDDGRVALIAGVTLLLLFSLSNAGLDEEKLRPLWPLRLLLDFVRDLGIAALVGGIVSLGIERISRQRFQQRITQEIKHIERSVISAAYNKRFPVPYTELVEKMLGNINNFRYTCNITIDVKETDFIGTEGDRLVEVTQTVSYFNHNITVEEIVLRPRLFVDANISGHPPKLLQWLIGGRELTPDELGKLNASSEILNQQKWYRFPDPVQIPVNDKVYVSSKVVNIRHARETTTWCGITPADSMRLTINHPKGFAAYAQPKMLGRPKEAPYVSDGERLVMEIFTPVLPYTTFEFGWAPLGSGQEVPPSGSAGLPSGDTVPILPKHEEIDDASSGSHVKQALSGSRWWKWW